MAAGAHVAASRSAAAGAAHTAAGTARHRPRSIGSGGGDKASAAAAASARGGAAYDGGTGCWLSSRRGATVLHPGAERPQALWQRCAHRRRQHRGSRLGAAA
eukprot:206175-Chlamydomonas_euryale.AAC.1